MKKKKVLILFIVLAAIVVLYLAWKRGAFASLGVSGSGGSGSKIPAIDPSQLIDSNAKPARFTDKQKIQQLKGMNAEEVAKWGVEHPFLNPFINPFMAPAFVVGYFK